MTLDTIAAFLRVLLHTVVDYWPYITAFLLLALRTRTPAAWVALGEKHPRTQGLIRALRGAGLDPVKLLQGLVQIVTAKAPLPAPGGTPLRTLAQRAYEAYGDAVGWRSVTGATMPPWRALPGAVQAAWVASLAGILTPEGQLPAVASATSGDAQGSSGGDDADDADDTSDPEPPTPADAPAPDKAPAQRGGATAEAMAFACSFAAACLPLGVVLAGCPRVTRDPVVAPPPAGCTAGATVCYAGTPWRCGPGNRWAQADRRCDRIGGVCCLTRSALTSAMVHSCTSTNRCERDPDASTAIVDPGAAVPGSVP